MNTTLRAFHGDAAVKQFYVERMKGHLKADEIIQGTGWEGGRGCAIGCTLHSYSHEQYEKELGVPMIIARLIDRIFEGMPIERARAFPLQVLEAIEPGADLSLVWPRYAHWLLADTEWGVVRHTKPESDQRKAVDLVAGLYARTARGEVVERDVWSEARKVSYAAADAAAAYAADAAAAYAADAAAAYDADAAADAAAYDAAYAYAARSRAAATARSNSWVRQGEKLLSLLAEASQPQGVELTH